MVYKGLSKEEIERLKKQLENSVAKLKEYGISPYIEVQAVGFGYKGIIALSLVDIGKFVSAEIAKRVKGAKITTHIEKSYIIFEVESMVL